jgi:3-oxoacyl-[acyl-carrier protein] reductase
MSKRLDGKVALVTGSSRSMGGGIATRFASEGAKVIINYIKNEEAAARTVAEIKGLGGDAIAIQADVGNENDVQRMVAAGVDRFGTIDILVNNAGMINKVELHEMSVDMWDEMIRTHLRGMFLCTRFVIPHMLKQGSGKIITVSGTFGITGAAGFTHISAAKAGLIGFSRALAREVGRKGINVNVISPAITRTDLYDFVPAEERDAIIATYPLGRPGEIKEIADTALFLASSESSFYTGQTLCPNGGDFMV